MGLGLVCHLVVSTTLAILLVFPFNAPRQADGILRLFGVALASATTRRAGRVMGNFSKNFVIGYLSVGMDIPRNCSPRRTRGVLGRGGPSPTGSDFSSPSVVIILSRDF